ncbi:hypothetical protein T484DRAFT_2868226 [Baffinella frigidus]|nr:hypothetical protein T484DRAFT_2868226 [Cryptophyta sp. CCMP2293]
MSAYERGPREEERQRVIRIRRRAKMEREIQSFCSLAGKSIEQVRTRLHFARQALEEYDSSDDITDPVLQRVQHRIEVLAGERSNVPPPQNVFSPPISHREPPPPQQVQSPERLARGPPSGGVESRWRDGSLRDGSSPEAGRRSGQDGEARHPSNWRYAAMSPSYQDADPVMPHRARGQVDEWAALERVERQRDLTEAERDAWENSRKKAAYMKQLDETLHAKHLADMRHSVEKSEDLRRCAAQSEKERLADQREREAYRRKQDENRSMFDQQLELQRRMQREEQERERSQDKGFLNAELDKQRREQERERQKATDRNREMVQVRQGIDQQLENKRLKRLQERENDVQVMQEYSEMMAGREQLRQNADDKRKERLGKIEMHASSNAERERRMREAEDSKFLHALSERERREEMALQEKAERDAMGRARYREDLDFQVDKRNRSKQQQRENDTRANMSDVQAFERKAAEEEAEKKRREQNSKATYKDELLTQMRGDQSRRHHWYLA